MLNQWVPSLGPSVAKQIRENFPSTEVESATVDRNSPTTDEVLVLTLDAMDLTRSSNAPWDSSQSYVKGGLKFVADYLDYHFEDSKSFIDKPWVEQFDKYISQRPGSRFFRAVSTDFGLSQQESEQSARNVAALMLASQVSPATNDYDRSMMASVILNSLDANGLIVDRFAQERDTSSGNKVWQTALLIDADSSKLNDVVRQYHKAKFSQQTKRHSGIGGIALLAVLVVILYFVINEFTKGYFVWNLRVSAMLLMLCLAVAFCWWVKIT